MAGSESAIWRRMQGFLDALDYDFTQFSLASFVRWVEQQQDGRRIVPMPWALPAGVSGAWLAAARCDYLFYARDTLPLHQTHIQLHELAHLLCHHPAASVQAGPPSPEQVSLLLRAGRDREAEEEAEVLAALIQVRVLYPGSATGQAARSGQFVARLATLRDLGCLHVQLARLCGSEIPPQPSWRALLYYPDTHVYRAVIHILDACRVLAARLSVSRTWGRYGRFRVHRTTVSPWAGMRGTPRGPGCCTRCWALWARLRITGSWSPSAAPPGGHSEAEDGYDRTGSDRAPTRTPTPSTSRSQRIPCNRLVMSPTLLYTVYQAPM